MIVFTRKIGSKKGGRLKSGKGSGGAQWAMRNTKANRGRLKANKRGQGNGKMSSIKR